jgi:hypothetical protein
MKVLSVRNLMKLHIFFHYIGYYTAWILAIGCVAADKGWLAAFIVLAITALQVVWQVLVAKRTQGLISMVFIFTLAGFIVDSSFLRSGIIFLYSNPWSPSWSPPWMISLWVSFAVFNFAVMKKFWGRYWINAVFALFGFPFAYFVGVKLGVGILPWGDLSVMSYGIVWAFLLPFCDYLFQRSQRI